MVPTGRSAGVTPNGCILRTVVPIGTLHAPCTAFEGISPRGGWGQRGVRARASMRNPKGFEGGILPPPHLTVVELRSSKTFGLLELLSNGQSFYEPSHSPSAPPP